MPGIYVYPGGRVGREDHLGSGYAERFPPPPVDIDLGTKRRWPAFLRAALRETFEETGLMLAHPLSPDAQDSQADDIQTPWDSFFQAGAAPDFEAARLIARAITPPTSPIRFHNRFFLADGRHLLGTIKGDGELDDIGWVPLSEALRLPMAGIGTHVLSEALGQWHKPKPARSALFRWVGNQMRPRFSSTAGSATD